jgi:Polyketide cyclase / dehydrase and lipid transport
MTKHHVLNLPHRVTAEVEIDAPIEQVFTYLTDPQNLAHWHQGVSDVRDVSGPPGSGQRYTYTAHFLGRRLTLPQEVTDFEPNTMYTVVGPYGGQHYEFEQKNGRTKVTNHLAVQDLHFLARVAEPLILRSGRRNQQHSLETLKDLLETHGPDHPR